MSDAQEKRLHKLYEEIFTLHGLTDAEKVCLQQMAAMVNMLGYPPALCTKLLKVLAAVSEVTVDEMKS